MRCIGHGSNRLPEETKVQMAEREVLEFCSEVALLPVFCCRGRAWRAFQRAEEPALAAGPPRRVDLSRIELFGSLISVKEAGMSERICPKCGSQMAHGFLPDSTAGAFLVGAWHEGTPQKALWRRTKVDFHEGIPIGAFRCVECGFLELYADPSFAAV